MNQHPEADKVLYPIPIYNGGSETIPGFAVVEAHAWEGDSESRDYVKVRKPTASGKQYFINGPFPIAAGKRGRATRQHGAYVLCGDDGPSAGDEWGPEAGKWSIGEDGSGWLVLGDKLGAAASEPGFPPTDSTKRVRVSILGGAGAKVSGAIALIRATVDAATIDEENEQVTPGIKVANAADKEGALLLTWNDAGDTLVADDSLGADGWVDAVNLALTDFRASVAEPMVVSGTYQAIAISGGQSVDRFVINDKDFRSLPGYVKASTKAQVPYHEIDDEDFQLDYDEC